MKCFAIGFSIAAFATLAAGGEVDFARDIQPILNAKCTECHGGVKAAGGVSFVYEEQVINFEGESGYPVVKPGDIEESELFYRITTDEENDFMPPPDDHPPLSKEEVALIKQWIEEGAEWSGHWAFQTPVKAELPKSSFDDQAKSNIDHFLFARLEKEGLEPSGVESPGRLLRRLSLGLTGLPPTLEEINAFESAYAEKGQVAMEQAVDDLLSRPAFGERWATMWLDLVRYADSGGLGQDQKRTIWAYRDWVVNAFNEDLSFDQFTIKQLAGDLLPNPTVEDLVATACNRNTQTNNEGGTDDETFRVEAVVDRINTTWQTWGGITFGCVQCHDHPYDPIRHEEYFTFMDFFNNSADSDLPNDAPLLKVPKDPNRYAEADKLRRQIEELKLAVWAPGVALRDEADWVGLKGISVSSNNTSRYEVKEKEGHDEFYTTGTVAIKTQTRIEAPAASMGDEPVTAIKLSVRPHEPKTSIHSPEWGFVITNLEAWVVADGEIKQEDGTTKKGEVKTPVKFQWSVPDVPWMPTNPTASIAANGKNWGADSRIHYERELVIVPTEPLAIEGDARLLVHISCDKTGHGSHPMSIKRGHLSLSGDARWSELGIKDTALYGTNAKLLTIVKEYDKIPGTTVPVMYERPERVARPTHVFARGNMLEKEGLVSAGLPASLVKTAPVAEQSGRLEMAEWWVSEKNPLTARVFVNRLWEQLFGIGIVPTLEDFGSSGEAPTHPELLDYLAIQFQEEHDWSTKGILREIVLSHAYQQASTVTPEMLEKNPDNRLVSRGPRLRLSAEMVRDQALAVSGLLSSKMGGEPVHPPLPAGVWKPFQGGDKWNTPKVGEENRYRRSLYTYVKRTIPFPAFATFDAPSREFCNPRRLTSNTPLQALVTLNDAAFMECAESLGKHLAEKQPGTVGEKLAAGHLLVTGREADESRINELRKLMQEVEKQSPQQAWTVTAQVLLNLDETLTY